MGDKSSTQTRTGKRLSDRLSMSRNTLEFSEQLCIGLVRIDTNTPKLNATAREWLDGHLDAFLAHPDIIKATRCTDPGAQTTFTLPTGRTLRIRRLSTGDVMWLALSDITLETDHTAVMADVADVGTGFLLYIPSTRRHRIYGSFLDQKLSPSEQLDLRRRGLVTVIHPRDRKRAMGLITKTLQDGEPFRSVIECRTRRGETFMLDLAGRAMRAGDGTICKAIAVFRDVTHQHRARADLARLRDEAASNREMQNHYLARIGHEIRTPMSGVIGMADALMHTEGTESFRTQLSVIQNATRDALSMLDETMDLSKLGANQFKIRDDAVDVAALVRETAELWVQRAAQAGTRLLFKTDPKLPDTVIVDARRLRQCLTNILSNAVKFTHDGTIEVILGKTDSNTVSDTVSGTDPNRKAQLVIAVRDTGAGMTPDELAELYMPFAQGAEGTQVSGSSGLGMSITREIIGRMGGAIRCSSTKGRGTTFVVTLPLREPGSGSRDLVGNLLAAGGAAHERMDLRVLAVDDNETNRLVVEHMLHGRVASVVLAEDGVDAIERLEDQPADQPFDVVLMDIHMPRMDGIEATLAIRNAGKPWSRVPIVALTADHQYQQKRVAMNLGMDDALPKPVTLSALLEMFERLKLTDGGNERKVA